MYYCDLKTVTGAHYPAPDVIMNMVLIYMGTHHKGMIAPGQLQRKLPPDLVRFFRRDFTGLEGLPEVVGDHIIRNPGITLIAMP